MPMDKGVLKDALGPAIKSAIDSVSDPTDRDALFLAMADAIANEVVDHIQNFATVSTAVTGTDSQGGAITGTGTGTPPSTGIS